MFAPVRRQDRLMSQADCVPVLEKQEYGVLSMYDESGYPYGIPLNYVYMNEKIYVHCALDVGQKVKNLKVNNKVCFTVVGETRVLPEKFGTNYESVVVFGEAKELVGEEKQLPLEGFLHKYSPDFIPSGIQYIQRAFDKVAIFEITPNHISGKTRRG